MKVLHLSTSDISGGGGFVAAYRIHHALREAGVDSLMWVNNAQAGDWTVESPSDKMHKLKTSLKAQLTNRLIKTLKTDNTVLHSPQLFSSAWINQINQSDASIVHLHWVQGEMLSVSDIGRIKKPVVWSLHDMWAFCGAEHYTEDERWRNGYYRHNRPTGEAGLDLNRWTWKRKLKHWNKPIHIICASKWMADCAGDSLLMKYWPITCIPYPIDTNNWKPIPKNLAKSLLGFPEDKSLVLFGAIGGGKNPRKGFDLLQQALGLLKQKPEADKIELVIFGQRSPQDPPDHGFPTHYSGHLHDCLSLRTLYSAADVMVVPSRQEAFGQTASEALTCGTPIVAFDRCGPPDIIRHQQTGYLAEPFNTKDLANGILWVLSNRDKQGIWKGQDLYEEAVRLYSYPVVSNQIKKVYVEALAEH